MSKTEYYAYLGGKLIDHRGYICSIGRTATTREEAVKLLRQAKKISGRFRWGRLDYIVKFGDTKTIIHPDKF